MGGQGELLQLAEALGKLAREKGFASIQAGGVTVILGPEPRDKAEIAKEKLDPHRVRRKHYAEMFGRPVGDDELKGLP